MNATEFAAIFGNDGSRWTTSDGRSFEGIIADAGIRPEYGQSIFDSESNQWFVEPTDQYSYFAGDPIRYEFADGSAIVVSGDGWDIEGDTPFSWRG